MKLVFADNAWEDYLHWQQADEKILMRLNVLIEEGERTPPKGKGKPEPLKGSLAGWRSRRITKADRLVYRVTGKGNDQQLEIAQCRFHF